MNEENEESSNPKKLRCIQSTYYLRSSQIAGQTFADGGIRHEHPPIKQNDEKFAERIHINRLPNEILCMIFSYFKTSELATLVMPVCKHWYAVAEQPLFWTHLKFGSRGGTKAILNIVEKSTLLRSIELHNRSDFEAILDQVYRSSSCRPIEEITLKMCPRKWNRSTLNEDFMNRTLIRKCCISPNCCQKIVGGGAVNVPYSINMLEYCPNLKKLHLINVIIRSKKFFGKIGGTLASLTSLTIVRCYHFSPLNLTLIATNCTQLSHVTILHNNRPLQLVPVPQRFEWNEAFNVLLQKRGSLLEVLELDAAFVLDITLKELSTSCRLHTLSLENALHLAIDGINAISTLRYLDHLHVHNSLGLNVETVSHLFGSGNLGRLETLSMKKCNNVNDKCLEIISTSCSLVNKINLSFCRLITDGGVELLFQRCFKLRYLNLFNTVGVHGSSFRLIPMETPSLKLLIIEEFCDKIKEKYTNALIARFPEIQITRLKQLN